MSQALKWKKRLALFYMNSGKLETTLTPTLDQTRLYYTILPLLRHLTYLWLCPSFGFSSLLQLSLLLWLSFHEALQSCSTDIPALDSIFYYTMQHFFKSQTIRFDQPLNYYSEIKRTCGYVLALDSPRCCSSACCYDYLLMKQSSPPILISVL